MPALVASATLIANISLGLLEDKPVTNGPPWEGEYDNQQNMIWVQDIEWGLGLGSRKLAFEVVVGNPGVVHHALDHPLGGHHGNITLGTQFLFRKYINICDFLRIITFLNCTSRAGRAPMVLIGQFHILCVYSGWPLGQGDSYSEKFETLNFACCQIVPICSLIS